MDSKVQVSDHVPITVSISDETDETPDLTNASPLTAPLNIERTEIQDYDALMVAGDGVDESDEAMNLDPLNTDRIEIEESDEVPMPADDEIDVIPDSTNASPPSTPLNTVHIEIEEKVDVPVPSSDGNDESSDLASDSWEIHQIEIKEGAPLELEIVHAEHIPRSECVVDVELPAKARNTSWNTFNDYISNSTIHGLRYFNDHHWLEKAWWIITFAAAASCCTVLIVNIYQQWQDHPVHIAFGSKPAKLWQIPYPALTICPVRKVKHEHVNSYYQMTLCRINEITEQQPCNLTADEEGDFDALALVCLIPITTKLHVRRNRGAGHDVYGRIREAAVPIKEFINYCDVAGVDVNECNGVFAEVMTQHGLCYTYNGLSHSDMFTDKITPEFANQFQHYLRLTKPEVDLALSTAESFTNAARLAHPRRVLGSADHRDNHFIVHMEQPREREDYTCDQESSGYFVVVHGAHEHPMHQTSSNVPLDGSVNVILDASVVAADAAIRDYPAEKRQCYFRGERKLEFFREYSRKNCELECLGYSALRDCGCVSFSTPRTSSTPVCTLDQVSCWTEVLSNSVHGLLSLNQTWPCDCLPACDEITYSMRTRKIVGNLVPSNYHSSQVSFTFGRNEFEIQRRVQQFGRLGFLANCGGLLGLFMGVSLLSLAEFVYFFSIRMLCNLRATYRDEEMD